MPPFLATRAEYFQAVGDPIPAEDKTRLLLLEALRLAEGEEGAALFVGRNRNDFMVEASVS